MKKSNPTVMKRFRLIALLCISVLMAGVLASCLKEPNLADIKVYGRLTEADTFVIGDDFLYGLTYKLVYDNDTESSVVYGVTQDMISGYEAGKIGMQAIVIKYKTVVKIFIVTIIADPTPQPTNIIVEGALTTAKYVAKGADVLTGSQVRIIFADGSYGAPVNVTSSMVSGYDTQVYGRQAVTVTYGGFAKTYNIIVTDKVISNETQFNAAIATQADGDYWFVENGVYNIQVVITKSVTIDGESKDGVIIAGLPDYTAMQTAVWVQSSNQSGTGLILVLSGENVAIKNLTVKGNPAKADYIMSIRYAGITVINGGVTIENTAVLDIRFTGLGPQNGFSVYAESNGKDIVIKGSNFENYSKNAVVVRATVRYLTYTGNTIVGVGSQSDICQNGLLTYCPATITGNTFRGIAYIDLVPADPMDPLTSVGIFLIGVLESDCIISGNIFDNVDLHIYEY
ncbi:MAG: hypothetical protein LBT30_06335 [Clostridiales bacterium]|jgi:hypothetical protein|nr:hypothetical protein [Clostridiales bacterium]